MVVRGEFDAVVNRAYACLYVMRRDGRPYALTHDELIHEFGGLVILEARMDRSLASAMGDHAYVLRGPDESALIAAAQQTQALR